MGRSTGDSRQAAPDSGSLLSLLMFIVGFNLQSGIFIVGPLLPGLSADLGISGSVAGALAAIPPLMMGLWAIPGGGLSQRLGPGRTIGLGLAMVGIAGALRGAAPNWQALLVLTVAFGAGIGIMQPAGPAFIRQHAASRVGPVTSIYTFGLVGGIIVASGLAGPLIAPLAGGWRGALIFWGILSILGAIAWFLAVRPGATDPAAERAAEASVLANPAWSPWRSRTVWILAALYATQGITFFLLGLWLPAIYGDAGLSAGAIGARMTVLAAASLPSILLMPAWSDRLGSMRLPMIVSAVITLAGAAGFVAATTAPVVDWLWPLLAGFGVGGVLVLVLVAVAVVSPPDRTGDAAAMVLAVGYTTTALGPFLAGVIRDLSGGYRTALLVLPVVAIAMILLSAAMPAARAEPAPDDAA
ncbi:MAG: CynX/NimT family MFS transporter [Chloroflexota bacterium]